MSWSDRFAKRENVKCRTKLTINQMLIQQTPEQDVKLSRKSDIPDYVRYEQEINSDDDMIIYGNTDNDTQELSNMNSKEFTLNYFNISEKIFLFKLILSYLLHMEDAIDFLKCCQKYAKIFKGNADLLYFWRFICQQRWGQVRFRKKRRIKASREVQLAKFNENINDYTYFRRRCQGWLNQQSSIKYDPEYGHLTFFKQDEKFHLMYTFNHYMIIVSEEEIYAKPLTCLLNPGYVSKSNWYDVQDSASKTSRKLIDPLEGIRRERRGYYARGIVSCRGYKKLNVDLMMEHLYIRKRGVKRYHIYMTSYTKNQCYLVEILPYDGKYDDLNIKRRCKLLGCDDKGMLIEFEAIILEHIVSVYELQLKTREKQKIDRRRKLKVLVYGMRLGSTSRYHHRKVFSGASAPNFVVVDYFE